MKSDKRKNRFTKQDVITAYHEAGHVIAAFRFKKRFRFVTIVPNDDTWGRVKWSKPWEDFPSGIKMNCRIRKVIETKIMINFAGVLAEKRFRGRKNRMGAGGDFENSFNLGRCVVGSDEELEAYLVWLWFRTKNLVNSSWTVIEKLADELLNCREMGYRKAREIVEKIK